MFYSRIVKKREVHEKSKLDVFVYLETSKTDLFYGYSSSRLGSI